MAPSPPLKTSRLTQHANDARLCAYATINVVRTPRQCLQQATALQLNPDEHVEHTDGRHRSAKEQKTGNGEHMCEKVVIHLAVGNEQKLNVIKEINSDKLRFKNYELQVKSAHIYIHIYILLSSSYHLIIL